MRPLGNVGFGAGARIGACLLAVAALGAAGGGCATVRRAREAQKTDRVPAGERTVTAAEAGLGTNTVLTVDGAIGIALTYYPSVVQARQNLAVATQQVRQARAAWKPSVNANAGYNRSTSNADAGSETSDSGSSYSAGLSVDQLLYDFGKTPASIRQACARQLAAQENLRAARSDVAFSVRTAFYDLARAQELLQVAVESERQYVVHLDQVRVLAEVGRRIRYDITKAEVDLGNARLDLINASNTVMTARAALNRSLGLAEEPGYRIDVSPIPQVPAVFEEGMRIARARHPQLQALKAQERAASAAVDAAIADLYPALNLSGDFGWSGAAFPLVWNWALAARTGLALFTGGRKTSAIEIAVSDLRSARTSVADREQQICLDMSKAFAQMDSAARRMALTDLIVRQAQESLNLVNERYAQGQASSVEVTDGQVALTRARADQVNARFDYQTAAALIRHTIGEE